MRKIPLKNYIILFIIVVLSGSAFIYFINLYNLRSNYEKSTHYTMSFLNEIHINDLENYLIGNPDMIIYINEKNDLELENVETKLKNHIIEKDYINDIVYINSNNTNKKLLKKLNKFSKTKLQNIPNVIITKDGMIQNELYFDENIDEFKIIEFMELYYND